jgi:hypothetical protein
MSDMGNSGLVTVTAISPNSGSRGGQAISAIVVHHMAGVMTAAQCGAVCAFAARQASCNYGIGHDGSVGLYVDEANRSWATSGADPDARAVTIEVSNSVAGGDWPVSPASFEKLVELCADICRRNGIAQLNYTGDKTGNLLAHKWYAATACPGPYLFAKFGELANRVNALLNDAPRKEPLMDAIEEYAGYERYSTCVLAVRAIKDKLDWSTVVISTGANYPDALTAANYAAIKAPLFIVENKNGANIALKALLGEYKGTISKVVKLGGESSLAASVANELAAAAGVVA